MNNFLEALTSQAAQRPEKAAVIYANKAVTFAHLERLSWQTSHYLASRGVRSADVVALTIKNEFLLLLSLLALARLGATSLTHPPGLPARVREEHNARVGVRHTLSDLSAPEPDNNGDIVIAPDLITGMPATPGNLAWEREPQAPLMIVTGSGSSGRPKLIAAQHIHFHRRMQAIEQDFAISPSDCFASFVPLTYTSTQRQHLQMLALGATVVLNFEALDPVKAVKRYGITYVSSTVFHLEQLLASLPKSTQGALAGLRILGVGFSTVSDTLRRRIVTALTPNLHITYGSNESGFATIARPPGSVNTSGTVGQPSYQAEVEIVDNKAQPVAVGSVGNIRIRSPHVIQGYLDDEASARSFRDGWFWPGDLGRFLPDGQLIHCGRADHMMIFNGINIYPAEIEHAITGHPEVKDAAAIPFNTTVNQDVPVCAVSLSAGSVATEKDLLDFCHQQLGTRGPHRIFILSEIPRNNLGKLVRSHLIEALRERISISRKAKTDNANA